LAKVEGAMIDCHISTVKRHGSVENDDSGVAEPELGIFAVADGLGGRAGGALASRSAIDRFVNALRAVSAADRLSVTVLQKAVATANASVLALSASDPSLSGLGTTLSAAVLNDRRGQVVHVGDSRVYLFRHPMLTKLTRDHTLIAELVERRHVSAGGAAHHPLRHVLSRSLGTAEGVEADIRELSLLPGDRLILASDGLAKALSEVSLQSLLSDRRGQPAKQICDAIMDAALQQAPADDITTVVVGLGEVDA